MTRKPAPLGELLDAERKARGLTHRALAEAAGLPPSLAHAILTGVTPNPGVLAVRRLCKALGRDLGWLDREMGD